MSTHIRAAALSLLLAAGTASAQLGVGGGGIPGGGTGGPAAGDRTLAIRPFASVSANYSSGLGSTSVNRTNSFRGYGYSLGYGASGSKAWQRTVVSLDYRGRFSDRLGNRFRGEGTGGRRNGTTFANIFAIRASRQLSPRWTVGAVHLTSILDQSLGITGPSQSVSEIDTDLPTDEVLAGFRTISVTSSVSASYRATARLSYSVGAANQTARRELAGLGESNSNGIFGSVSYQLSPRQSVGGVYGYSRFSYRGAFGRSDVNGGGLQYSVVPARNWLFTSLIGMVSARSLRLEAVPLDPVVADLLGRSQGLEPVNRSFRGLLSQLRLSRQFRLSSVGLSYQRGISPGNGLLLTSQREAYQATYSFNGIRDWALQANASRSRLIALTQTATAFDNTTLGFSASRNVVGFLHFTTSTFYRRVNGLQTGSGFRPSGYTVSAGLSFSPGPQAIPGF